MEFKNITVAGSGVLGSQIAFQTAFHGFNVTVYDINDEALQSAKDKINILKARYQEDLKASQEQVDAAYDRISFYSDLAKASAEADLLIEAIPEIVPIKTEFYQNLSKVAPEKTVNPFEQTADCSMNSLCGKRLMSKSYIICEKLKFRLK